MNFARAVRGSNWIEGYRASLDDVLDVIEDEEPVDAAEQTRSALAGYRDAMTYVLELAEDRVTIDESLIKSLHYMMTKHELRVRPGRYRTGDVWVEDEGGTRVYQAPDAGLVEGLMGSLVESLSDSGPRPGHVPRRDGSPQPGDDPSVPRRQRADGAGSADDGPRR